VGRTWLRIAALGEERGFACLHGGTYLYRLFSVVMRLLLLAVLALAAVALGAAQEPRGGCDYDFGAGNGTAYLVVNNPYNLNLSLSITYQSGELKYSKVRNFSNTRVIVFCGLGNGWLYIRQNASQLRSPLAFYPLAVPRYVVLRAGEAATMSVTTLFAPAVTIATAFLLLVAFTLRPKLKRSAVYALPDALRDEDIHIKYFSFIYMVLMAFIPLYLLFILLIGNLPISNDVGNDPLMEVIVLLIMYITSSLGGFYLSFHRGLFTYYYLVISFLVNLFLSIKYSGSVLSFSLFTLSIVILFISSITPSSITFSSITLLSFYNLSMTFFLSAYGIAALIYYDANFGHPITWNLPLQIPAVAAEIWLVIFPVIVTIMIFSFFGVIMLTYGIDIFRGRRAVATRTALWPPLWWWFGLGVFALDELEARSLLHRLSASSGVVVELARGRKAIVVSADLYGMYLNRLEEERNVSKGVKWVRYGEVQFRVLRIIKIIKRSYWHVALRFIRKVVLPIVIGALAYFLIKTSLLTIFIHLLFHIIFLFDYYKYVVLLSYFIKKINYAFLSFLILVIVSPIIYYKYNDFRELKEYIKSIKESIKKEPINLDIEVLGHLTVASIFFIIFAFLTSDFVVLGFVFLIAVTVSFFSRADPELSRYLFPWLELRLMRVDGSVIALARGGCLKWAKVGVAPEGRDIVIRDEDCEVVVSPYVEQKESRPQCDLCGPAYPPVRIIGGERVVVRVLDGQKGCCYYVLDSSTTLRKSVRLFKYLAQVWRHMLGMRRGR